MSNTFCVRGRGTKRYRHTMCGFRQRTPMTTPIPMRKNTFLNARFVYGMYESIYVSTQVYSSFTTHSVDETTWAYTHSKYNKIYLPQTDYLCAQNVINRNTPTNVISFDEFVYNEPYMQPHTRTIINLYRTTYAELTRRKYI